MPITKAVGQENGATQGYEREDKYSHFPHFSQGLQQTTMTSDDDVDVAPAIQAWRLAGEEILLPTAKVSAAHRKRKRERERERENEREGRREGATNASVSRPAKVNTNLAVDHCPARE